MTVLYNSLQDLHKLYTTTRAELDKATETLIINNKIMKEQHQTILDLQDRMNVTVSTSKHAAAEVEEIHDENNKEQDDGDDSDDNDEVANNKRPRQFKFVPPPEYDENDSRWTLKHRELAPGLVELIPHSRVYIDAAKLRDCKRIAKDCKSLTGLLYFQIFTKTALAVCSLTNNKTYVSKNVVRPGLDKDARRAILTFVEGYRREKGWIRQDFQTITTSVRNKMVYMRKEYNNMG